jgi:hypothetical protein
MPGLSGLRLRAARAARRLAPAARPGCGATRAPALAPGVAAAVARARATEQEVARRQRPTATIRRRRSRGAERDARLGDAEDRVQPLAQLGAQRGCDDRGRDSAHGHQDLAGQARVAAAGVPHEEQHRLRGDEAGRAQHLAERPRGQGRLHPGDQAVREVDAVHAPGAAPLGELQRSGGGAAVQDAEEVAERRGSETSRELHRSSLTASPCSGPLSGRRPGAPPPTAPAGDPIRPWMDKSRTTYVGSTLQPHTEACLGARCPQFESTY